MQFHLLETDNVGQNAVLSLLWRECTRIMQFYPMETDNVGQNALLICFLEVCKPHYFEFGALNLFMCVCVFVNNWMTCVYGFISKGGGGHVL